MSQPLMDARPTAPVARTGSIVIRRSADGSCVGPTGTCASSNPAFTLSRRSCGAVISAHSLRAPLYRHALVPVAFRFKVRRLTSKISSES